jgi:hypothetical protein
MMFFFIILVFYGWLFRSLCDSICCKAMRGGATRRFQTSLWHAVISGVLCCAVLCRELGQDEQLQAAGLMWAHLVQPMQLWEEVLPLTLRPSQQKQLKRM